MRSQVLRSGISNMASERSFGSQSISCMCDKSLPLRICAVQNMILLPSPEKEKRKLCFRLFGGGSRSRAEDVAQHVRAYECDMFQLSRWQASGRSSREERSRTCFRDLELPRTTVVVQVHSDVTGEKVWH